MARTRKPAGLTRGRVELHPYAPDWPRHFEDEAAALRAALGADAAAVEHIGSTAVPGMPAKPVIDIAILLRDGIAPESCAVKLRAAGYAYEGEHGLPGRHFFVKGDPATHHVHVVSPGSRHWDRWIRFRELLRRDASVRERYGKLKRRLAAKFADDRNSYTAAKDPFIDNALRRGSGIETAN